MLLERVVRGRRNPRRRSPSLEDALRGRRKYLELETRRAVDRELQEIVAIKTLKPELIAADETALERFKSEIRLARKISHRNVVRTHDLGEARGLYFITMEFVEGTSLEDLIRARGRLPVQVMLRSRSSYAGRSRWRTKRG